MKLSLSDDQWKTISGKLNERKPPSDLDPLVFVMAEEGTEHADPRWTTGETLIDSIVKTCQPRPSITHAELFVPTNVKTETPHFATYIFKTADWIANNSDNKNFYLNLHGGMWRAVPVACVDAGERVRVECSKHIGTPYSIGRYAFSAPPLRSLSGMLPSAPQSSAHCATLTTRILQRSLPELKMEHNDAWYGPSTLFIEAATGTMAKQTHSYLKETEQLHSLVETESMAHAHNTLLSGSDSEVSLLTDDDCDSAVRLMSTHACNPSVDSETQRIVQKQLATALLRASIVRRQVASS